MSFIALDLDEIQGRGEKSVPLNLPAESGLGKQERCELTASTVFNDQQVLWLGNYS